MAVANKIIEELDFVNQINQATTWERAHWNISPGNLAKMLVMGTFTDMRYVFSPRRKYSFSWFVFR